MLSLHGARQHQPAITCSSPEIGRSIGHWVGGGTADLGVNGFVTDVELSEYLPTFHDVTQSAIAAFDMVCATPLSVTAIWTLTDDEQLEQTLEAAGGVAAQHALGYLQQNAAATLRGPGGVRQIGLRNGLIGVRFQHGQAYNGAPDLHDHIMILNLALGDDGLWGPLDQDLLTGSIEAASEHHTRQLIAAIEDLTGLRFQDRHDSRDQVARWELALASRHILEPFRGLPSVRDQAVTT